MTDSQHSEQSRVPSPQGGDPKSVNEQRPSRNRRRIALATGATPVLFALMNRPLMAQDSCTADTPSGHASANASGRLGDREELACGTSPGYWGNNGNGGGSDDPHLEETFKGVFGSINHVEMEPGVDENLLTLGDILTRPEDGFVDPDNLARAFAGAYMNARETSGYPLSVTLVLEMWNEVDTKGYLMVSGNTWYKSDVKQYLESTYEGSADDD